MKKSINMWVSAMALPLCVATAQAAPAYYVTLLPTLGSDNFAVAADINNSGQVVGQSAFNSGPAGNPLNGPSSAFLWTPANPNGNTGSITNLGLGSASGINSGGQIVGSSGSNAVIWNPGSTSPVTLSVPAGTSSATATAINDSGTVTINTQTPASGATFISGAAVWTPSTPNGTTGTVRTLGDIPPSTNSLNNVAFAFGINNANRIVGGSVSNGSAVVQTFVGVLWEPGATCGGTPNCTQVADIAGGPNDLLFSAINEAGVIVGVGNNATGQRVVRSVNGGAPSVLGSGALAGDAVVDVFDINESGVVVGASGENPAPGGGNRPTAFFYSDADGMLDLNSLIAQDDPLFGSIFLSAARGINDNGDIVGDAYFNGQRVAFLLTQIAPIPVPAAVWLLGSALIGLGALRRQRVSPV